MKLPACQPSAHAAARSSGWSLSELLVSLALMAVLAGVALPTFQAQQRQARRSDAQSALQQLQLAQARWRGAQGSHATDLAQLGWASDVSPGGHYRLAIEDAHSEGYSLIATPIGGQACDTWPPCCSAAEAILQAIQVAAGGNELFGQHPPCTTQASMTPRSARPWTDGPATCCCAGPRHACQATTQGGESLVSLLVGLGVGLLVLAAGSQMLAQHLQGHRLALQDSHVHHDLRSALDTMARELRQAQSLGQAWRGRVLAHCADAFCTGDADLLVQGQRISFAHDRNQNGLLDNNECSGFRLKDHELQIRTACSPEVWTDLTDAGSLKMTGLQWHVQCEKRGRWAVRWVTVQLSAHWPRDPSRALSLSQTVSLRNDVPASPWPAVCGAAP